MPHQNGRRLKPLALACVLLYATPGLAQETATQLPTVEVTAEEESATGPVYGYAAKRSATATKTDTPLAETPQSITVISAQQIRDQNAQTIQEVLYYAAGVRAEQYGLDNRGDWFTLRGGSEGSTLLDGLRLPLSGYYGSLRNEPYAFERVEVLRGPSSVVAGQNGPGGVINLVSKRPLPVPMREVGVQYGSHDHKQIMADLTGPLNEDGSVLYRLVALHKDSGTQVHHADEERQFFAPSLTWRNNRTSITAYYEYQDDESGNTNAFLPWDGTVNPGPKGRVPTSFFVSEPDWDTYGGTRHRFGYHVTHDLNDAWTLRQNYRHDDIDGHMLTMFANFLPGGVGIQPDGTIGRSWFASRTDSRIDSADFLAEGRLNWGDVQHTVLLGVDAMWMRDDQRTDGGLATDINVYDPIYGSFAKPNPNFGPGDPIRSRRIGFVAQDQIKVNDRWVFVGSLRRDFSRSGTESGETQKDAAWTKRLGAVYLGNGGVSPYLSYSESFEPISGKDASGDVLKPLRGKQWEAGIRWQPMGDKLTLSAAAYRLKEENRTSPHPDPLVTGSLQKGEVRVKGIELEAVANLPSWDIIGYYTHTTAELTESSVALDELNEQLQGIPKHAAALWAVHKFSIGDTPGFRAGLGARYVGTTEDGAGGQRVPAYMLYDAMISFDHKSWRFALNATNLFDKEYVAACLSRGDCWYGSRREIVATATYNF